MYTKYKTLEQLNEGQRLLAKYFMRWLGLSEEEALEMIKVFKKKLDEMKTHDYY